MGEWHGPLARVDVVGRGVAREQPQSAAGSSSPGSSRLKYARWSRGAARPPPRDEPRVRVAQLFGGLAAPLRRRARLAALPLARAREPRGYRERRASEECGEHEPHAQPVQLRGKQTHMVMGGHAIKIENVWAV